jgi:hypothetical protein
MSALNLDSTVVHHPGIVAADMDGETVMMSIEAGDYFGLNDVGTFLWEFMAEPAAIKNLCRRVLDSYEVDEATCQTGVLNYVSKLLDRGVIKLAD